MIGYNSARLCTVLRQCLPYFPRALSFEISSLPPLPLAQSPISFEKPQERGSTLFVPIKKKKGERTAPPPPPRLSSRSVRHHLIFTPDIIPDHINPSSIISIVIIIPHSSSSIISFVNLLQSSDNHRRHPLVAAPIRPHPRPEAGRLQLRGQPRIGTSQVPPLFVSASHSVFCSVKAVFTLTSCYTPPPHPRPSRRFRPSSSLFLCPSIHLPECTSASLSLYLGSFKQSRSGRHGSLSRVF